MLRCTLSDVSLVVSPRADCEWEEAAAERRAQAAKQAAAQNAQFEALQAARGGCEGESKSASPWAHLLEALQLEILSVQLRFNAADGTALGLRLASVRASPPGEPAAPGTLSKALMLEGLSAYVQPAGAGKEDAVILPATRLLLTLALSAGGSATDGSAPVRICALLPDSLALRLSCAQLGCVARLLDDLDVASCRARWGRHRPLSWRGPIRRDGWAADGWRYAFAAVSSQVREARRWGSLHALGRRRSQRLAYLEAYAQRWRSAAAQQPPCPAGDDAAQADDDGEDADESADIALVDMAVEESAATPESSVLEAIESGLTLRDCLYFRALAELQAAGEGKRRLSSAAAADQSTAPAPQARRGWLHSGVAYILTRIPLVDARSRFPRLLAPELDASAHCHALLRAALALPKNSPPPNLAVELRSAGGAVEVTGLQENGTLSLGQLLARAQPLQGENASLAVELELEWVHAELGGEQRHISGCGAFGSAELPLRLWGGSPAEPLLRLRGCLRPHERVLSAQLSCLYGQAALCLPAEAARASALAALQAALPFPGSSLEDRRWAAAAALGGGSGLSARAAMLPPLLRVENLVCAGALFLLTRPPPELSAQALASELCSPATPVRDCTMPEPSSSFHTPLMRTASSAQEEEWSTCAAGLTPPPPPACLSLSLRSLVVCSAEHDAEAAAAAAAFLGDELGKADDLDAAAAELLYSRWELSGASLSLELRPFPPLGAPMPPGPTVSLAALPELRIRAALLRPQGCETDVPWRVQAFASRPLSVAITPPAARALRALFALQSLPTAENHRDVPSASLPCMRGDVSFALAALAISCQPEPGEDGGFFFGGA